MRSIGIGKSATGYGEFVAFVRVCGPNTVGGSVLTVTFCVDPDAVKAANGGCGVTSATVRVVGVACGVT